MREILHTPTLQPKLAVGPADDAFEREADRVADQVMRMPEPPGDLQRMCSECEEELHRQPLDRAADGTLRRAERPGTEAGTSEVGGGLEARVRQLRGGGRPLPEPTRAFFESRFGAGFGDVRIHTGRGPHELARSLDARAFTVGRDVVFGAGEYAPETPSGRRLLAHELTHVVQQSGEPGTVRRQVRLREAPAVRRLTIHASCRGHEKAIQDAWKEGGTLATNTVARLTSMKELVRKGGVPATVMPGTWGHLENAFGKVSGLPVSSGGGYVSFRELDKILDGFQKMAKVFTGGNRSIRCDTTQVLAQLGKTGFCGIHAAFVLSNPPRQYQDWIFLCPSFLSASTTTRDRGLTLVHEMAHSVLKVGHNGGVKSDFTCGSLGFTYEQAIDNAYAYEHLVRCFHGGGQKEGSVVTGQRKAPKPPKTGRRWTLSAAGGISLLDRGELQGMVSLGTKVGLRTGSALIFNPMIGLNLLYAPGTTLTPQHLAAATVDVGLRLQQPLKGFYFDASAGGFGGLRFEPGSGTARPTAGLGLTGGVGWRLKRIEVGAKVKGLFPLTSKDRARLLILARVGISFWGP